MTITIRVHTVASFDADGEGIDHRYEDCTFYDVDSEEQAIECAESMYRGNRLLTGLEIL